MGVFTYVDIVDDDDDDVSGDNDCDARRGGFTGGRGRERGVVEVMPMQESSSNLKHPTASTTAADGISRSDNNNTVQHQHQLRGYQHHRQHQHQRSRILRIGSEDDTDTDNESTYLI